MTKTYAQITREIAALQSTANKLYALEVKEAVAKINELISKYDLSAADLKFAGASPTGASAKDVAKVSAPKATVAGDRAKYSDGQGRVWGGRGPRPVWLRSALDAGQSLESFLTDAKSAVLPAASKVTARVSGAAPTQKPASAGVPKYQHPKTGVTWTGRGPRPQWLKAALRKRGSAIEDFLIGAPIRTDAAAVAPTPVALPAEKSAAKKASAKKIVLPKVIEPVAAKSAAKTATQTASPAKKTSTKALTLKAAVKLPSTKAAPAKKTSTSRATVKPSAPLKTPAAKKAVAVASRKTIATAKLPAASKVAKASTKTSDDKLAVPVAPAKPLLPRSKAKKTVTTLPAAPVTVASTLPDAVTPTA